MSNRPGKTELVGERKKIHMEEGWTRQFVAAEPRLSEAVELYRSLGLEVRLEPISSEGLQGDCTVCMEAAQNQFWVIYTRSRSPEQESSKSHNMSLS